MPRFGLATGLPASNPRHRFTLTRLPEPSVLAPIGTDLAESSWGGPSSFGSSPRLPRPPATRRCSVHSFASPDAPRRRVSSPPSNVPAGLRLRRHPKATPVRSDPTSAPVSRDVRRLVVAVALPEESDRPVRGGREHCPCSGSAVPRERCGLGRSPPPHRPGRHALSGTMSSKDPAKTLVKRYFRIHRVIPATFSLPPGFPPSSTRCPPFVHMIVHRARGPVWLRRS